jgi:hypothetical protein
MSYQAAKRCFDENLQALQSPETDPQAWNLNTGLSSLTEAVEYDLRQIRTLLSQILQDLKR